MASEPTPSLTPGAPGPTSGPANAANPAAPDGMRGGAKIYGSARSRPSAIKAACR